MAGYRGGSFVNNFEAMILPNDISRCSNERCKKKLKCKRYLDCLPWETYSYSEFDEKDCKFFIENELKKREVMREIKFKAIRKDNGKWVYGDLVHHYSIKNGERTDHVSIGIDLDFYEVIPETIGQFTGLKDKNGVEIYEGDIFHLGDKNIIYTVVWHDTGLIGKQNGASSYVGLEHWKEHIEVIGNIHDKNEQKQALIDMMRGDEEIG